jgi:hypothetical protein
MLVRTALRSRAPHTGTIHIPIWRVFAASHAEAGLSTRAGILRPTPKILLYSENRVLCQLDCFGKSELKFCFSHLLSVMTTATNDFKERRGA